MSPHHPLSAELLLEQRSFLMGLARSLVVDEQHAEDVVQETYLAAWRKPPPPGVRLAAWLATVTRNLALRSRRSEGRLRRREGAAAKPEGVQATVDVSARLELQRLIADAVARLDEPGRSAIVWRYFDGLPPREIARQEGVSVRTIESRLRRARQALRVRLDEAQLQGTADERRQAWCAVLIPVVASDLPTSLTSSAAAAAAASPATTTASAVGGLAAAATVGATIVSTKLIIGAAVIGAAAAFYVGRETAPSPTTAPASVSPTTTSVPAEGPALEGADVEVLLAERDRSLVEAQDEIVALRKEKQELLARIAQAEAEHAKPDHPAGAEKSISDRFAGDRYKSVVSAIEWTEAGEAAAHMLPLLNDLSVAMQGGKDVPDNIGIEIFQWNQKLQKVALAAVSNKTPGTGGNGAFTHPVVSLNLIAATLEQAKHPLDERQLEKLYDIGDRFVAEDDRRRGTYTEETFQIQKTLEECDLKDRMYAEVDGILTEQQRELLHPKAVRGRLGVDIFSSGVIYYTLAKPVDFKTRDELAAALVSKYQAKSSLTDTELAGLQMAAKEWADRFPEASLQSSGEEINLKSRAQSGGVLVGWQAVTYARECAQLQLELSQALFQLVSGSAEKVSGLRADATIYMPVLRK